MTWPRPSSRRCWAAARASGLLLTVLAVLGVPVCAGVLAGGGQGATGPGQVVAAVSQQADGLQHVVARRVAQLHVQVAAQAQVRTGLPRPGPLPLAVLAAATALGVLVRSAGAPHGAVRGRASWRRQLPDGRGPPGPRAVARLHQVGRRRRPAAPVPSGALPS